MKNVPITVFTGYLGSGKTTIILNLIKSLPKDYRIVWLKNEFGDIAIDSELAKVNNISVKEMVNGCLCCVLVGKLGNAISEILDKYSPERIIIETSGSAYPAPIAWEIRKLEKEYEGKDKIPYLDSIITVIDVLNFEGYMDVSYTAKLQAKYTDLILLNKHELVDEVKLDKVLDFVYELNPTTPKLKTDKGRVNKEVIFGLDTILFESEEDVDRAKIGQNDKHQEEELDILEYLGKDKIDISSIESLLSELPSKYFFRIKGIINSNNQNYLINYVFGRSQIQTIEGRVEDNRLLFLGKNILNFKDKIEKSLGIKVKYIGGKD